MNLQQVKRTFERLKIEHVKLGGFDIDGVLRGKYISLEKFFSAADSGLGFCDVIFGWDSSDALYDNVTLTGWHTGYPDALARIDLSTFAVLPGKETRHFSWSISSKKTAHRSPSRPAKCFAVWSRARAEGVTQQRPHSNMSTSSSNPTRFPRAKVVFATWPHFRQACSGTVSCALQRIRTWRTAFWTLRGR